ncbi:MAG: TonB-dependent receptor [Prevotellaceae bacterium]|jgi:hypothetical protein|nr:TonB-dependent receptor [Prevotellaceae bacterium]
MLKKSCFFFAFLLFAVALQAQKTTLSGKVSDAQSGEPLVGATIFVRELGRSASTNESGYYTFDVKPGTYNVNVGYLGYTSTDEQLRLKGKSLRKNFKLTEEANQIEAVTVNAEKRANVTKAEMSVEKLDIKTIKKIPQLMGEVDVIKSIMLLPGVQPAAEGTSAFNVRGGSSDQNLILFDNSTVYNASHFMGFFSVFNNDVVNDVKLYKGDIPVSHGGRLSSMLEVSTKEGDMEKFNVNGGVGLISSRLEVDGPIVNDKLSFVAAGRRTYADLFLPLAAEQDLDGAVLHFYDLNGKLTWKASEKDRLSLSGYFGRDVFGMGNDMAGMDFSNATYSLAWTHRFSDKFFMNSTVLGSRYSYDLTFDFGGVAGKWLSTINDVGLREDFTYLYNDDASLKFGAAATYHSIMPCDASMDITMLDDDQRITLPSLYSTEYALYAMHQHKVGERLTLKYGLRGTLFQNLGNDTVMYYDENYKLGIVDKKKFDKGEVYNSYFGLEPRVGAVFQINDNSSVKGSYSRTLQYLHLMSNASAASPLDVWLPSSPNIKPQSAHQGSVGYFRNFLDDAVETSGEIFYKRLNNVVDFKDHAQLMMNQHLEGEVRSGIGEAYGLELMVRKNTGKFTGWVSYTYSRSFRKIKTVNNDEWYSSPADKPHALNIVLSYELTKRIDLSASWTYSTGAPATFPESGYYLPDGVFAGDNDFVPLYGKRNSYRTPDYHRLDVAATFELRKRGGYEHELNVSLYNAYGRHNPWFIQFADDDTPTSSTKYAESIYLFSVVPSVTYNFKF